MRIFATIFACLFGIHAHAASISISVEGGFVGPIGVFEDPATGLSGGPFFILASDGLFQSGPNASFFAASTGFMNVAERPYTGGVDVIAEDCQGLLVTLCNAGAFAPDRTLDNWDFTFELCATVSCNLNFSPAGYSFVDDALSYAIAFSSTTVAFAQEEPSVIPLPASAWLLITVVLGLWGLKRQRSVCSMLT